MSLQSHYMSVFDKEYKWSPEQTLHLKNKQLQIPAVISYFVKHLLAIYYWSTIACPNVQFTLPWTNPNS